MRKTLIQEFAAEMRNTNRGRTTLLQQMALRELEEGNNSTLLQEAASTSDFPALLRNTMHKGLLKAWNSYPLTYENIVSDFMNVKDFKDIYRERVSDAEGLLPVREHGEYKDSDLLEEDPFHAEDVIAHLSNEMFKQISNRQAQGDRLAGLEEDTAMSGAVADELEAGAIGTHLDEGAVKELEMALLDVGTQAEVDQYMDSLKRSKDTFDNIDDYIEDFKNYVADKALQEHFGRFMKDYQ